MRKYLILSFALVAFSRLAAVAQDAHCGTDKMLNEWIGNDASRMKAYQDFLFEERVDSSFENGKLGKKTVVIVPVVFHVIHNYGVENISKEQILNQMETLNKDYRRQNADTSKTRSQFKSIAADMEIEFRLATKDPDGNCTDGITRTVSELTYGGDESVKELVRWDYTKYLNVWVIHHIGMSNDDGTIIAGYSRFPFQTSSKTDGIIVDYRFIGSIGTSSSSVAGRTLTHEVGHWFGLLHPFQDGCGSTDCSRTGDLVCDTPPVESANFGCPLTSNSCSNDSPDQLDNVENYMDYANGSCQNMFTAGQKSRIYTKYMSGTNSRASNITSATHEATGIFLSNPCAPKADFHTSDYITVICQGSAVTFQDLSWNGDITDRVWTFEGGSPSSSTFEAPVVTYNSPGKYKVTLKAINAQGESEISKTEFIEVLPAEANIKSPYQEPFESEYSPLLWKGLSTDTYGWKIKTGNSNSGQYAAVCVIDASDETGNKYNLYSPPIDLTLHKDLSPKLSFHLAYSLRSSGSGERMVIYGSDDCGKSWLALTGLVGASNMNSHSGNNPDWVPTSSSDWKVIDVNLNQHSFQNSTHLMLRFEVTSAAGNSIFIDDINIDQFSLSTKLPEGYPDIVNISQNANNSGQFTVQSAPTTGTIHMTVVNAVGETVLSLDVPENSEQQFRIFAPGVYILRFDNGSRAMVKKIIVAQ
ncbi:MAG: PKD domain-containing protein [Bacteroidetes bacterium]|nr:PKD domain-containing protein [Bacteroidota bacterium]